MENTAPDPITTGILIQSAVKMKDSEARSAGVNTETELPALLREDLSGSGRCEGTSGQAGAQQGQLAAALRPLFPGHAASRAGGRSSSQATSGAGRGTCAERCPHAMVWSTLALGSSSRSSPSSLPLAALVLNDTPRSHSAQSPCHRAGPSSCPEPAACHSPSVVPQLILLPSGD